MKKVRKLLALIISLMVGVLAVSGIAFAQEDIPVQTDEGVAQQQDAEVSITYQAHVSDIGWMDPVGQGATAGTTGQSKQLEALIVNQTGLPEDSTIEVQSHCTNVGWQGYVPAGAESGTTGQGLKMQAIQMRLTGSAQELYDIYYRMHVANFGWLDWTANDGVAGTTGLDYPAEAIEIQLLPKGSPAPGETSLPYVSREYVNQQGQVHYISYLSNIGWLETRMNGADTGVPDGTNGIEGLVIAVPAYPQGGVQYQAYVSNVGWEGWKRDADPAGQPGTGNLIEAFQVELYGDAARVFDVYYQAQSEGYGWLGWTGNGAYAGTMGGGRRIQALKIVLVPKGQPAPTYKARTAFFQVPARRPNPVGGECVYISIPDQMLYYYSPNGDCVLETPVTTGSPGTENATPTGRFSLLGKSRDVILRGSTYSSFVSYWMNFIGQVYGLHDADGWRENFGGDVYLYDGSHGCVNLPHQAAAALYSFIHIGCPIIIE